MATNSGTIYKEYGPSGTGYKVQCNWAGAQNTSTNSSVVVFSVWHISDYAIYKGSVASDVTVTYKYTLNGKTVTKTLTSSGYIGDNSGASSVKLCTLQAVIPHNDDGTMSFTYSCTVGVNWTSSSSGTTFSNITASTTTAQQLGTISRGTTISSFSASASGIGKIAVSWATADNITKLEYSTNGGTSYTTKSSSVNAKSGSFTITGLADNTKYSVKIRVTCDDITTTSSTVSVTTNTPTTITSISNCTISSSTPSVPITVSNTLSYYMRITSIKVTGTGSETDISATINLGKGTPTSFTIPSSVMTSIYEQMTTITQARFRVVMKVYSDSGYSTLVSTFTSGYANFILDTAYATPGITGVSVTLDDKTQGFLGSSNEKIIQNLTRVTFTMNGVSAKCGASIKNYEMSYQIDNTGTKYVIAGITSNSFSVILSRYGNLYFTATVTDSRGLSKSVTFNKECVEYYNPTIDAIVCKDAENRSNMNIQSLIATYTNTIDSSDNSITIKYGYVATGTPIESDAETTIEGYTPSVKGNITEVSCSKSDVITNISNDSSYKFIFVITDSIGSKATCIVDASDAIPIIRILQNGRVGINSAVNGDNILTVGGSTIIKSNLRVEGHLICENNDYNENNVDTQTHFNKKVYFDEGFDALNGKHSWMAYAHITKLSLRYVDEKGASSDKAADDIEIPFLHYSKCSFDRVEYSETTEAHNAYNPSIDNKNLIKKYTVTGNYFVSDKQMVILGGARVGGDITNSGEIRTAGANHAYSFTAWTGFRTRTGTGFYIGHPDDISKYAALAYMNTNCIAYLGYTSVTFDKNDIRESKGTYIRGKTVKLTDASNIETNSDLRLKESFITLDNYKGFFMDLKPIGYKYINGSSGRYHVGFGAQHVLQSLEDNNLSSMDFAGFVENNTVQDPETGYEPDYDVEYGLIYTEFVALNTYMIQETIKHQSEQDEEISNIKNKLNEALDIISHLKNEIEVLKGGQV